MIVIQTVEIICQNKGIISKITNENCYFGSVLFFSGDLSYVAFAVKQHGIESLKHTNEVDLKA